MARHISIIAALDENNLIGNNNQLPWHLPADLAYFQQQTLHKTVVMGRKTYQSIGGILPKRKNIIISQNKHLVIKGATVINDVKQIEYLDDDIMIIGGAHIYQQTLNSVDYLLITKIHHCFKGDTYFPTIGNNFHLINKEDHKPDKHNNYSYSFLTFKRMPA